MNQLIEVTTTRANPGIDPSLHAWGWEIVVYLFLGGLVAGIFVLAASLELRSGEKPRGDALRLMPFAALALLSVGMLALWLDLAHKLWAWRFYLFFHATSPMSWGAWILVLIYPVGLLLGLGSMSRGAARRGCAGRRRRRFGGSSTTLFGVGRRPPPRHPRDERRDGGRPRDLHRPPPRDDAVAHPLEQRRPRAALPRLGHLDRRRAPPPPAARGERTGRRSSAGTPSRSSPSSS